MWILGKAFLILTKLKKTSAEYTTKKMKGSNQNVNQYFQTLPSIHAAGTGMLTGFVCNMNR